MEHTMIATLCVAVIFLLFEYLSILKKMKDFMQLLVGYLAERDKITLEDMQDISIKGIEKITKELENK